MSTTTIEVRACINSTSQQLSLAQNEGCSPRESFNATILDSWFKKTASPSDAKPESVQKEEQVEPLESKLINFASFHHLKTNVALFTDEEIASQPCQLEREKRRFWNSKLKQLSLSKEVDHYNKTEIIGIVNTAWTFKKAQLLQIMASELRVMQERIQTVYAERYPNIIGKTCTDPLLLSSSINKNLKSVAKLIFFAKLKTKNCSK